MTATILTYARPDSAEPRGEPFALPVSEALIDARPLQGFPGWTAYRITGRQGAVQSLVAELENAPDTIGSQFRRPTRQLNGWFVAHGAVQRGLASNAPGA